jgi:putative ABC transport system ATP-binding protein
MEPSGSSANHTVLHTEQLGRRVGDTWLVHDINLEVRQGDVIAVVGPSGAGKSSFLRLLNRLDEPTTGSIFLDGQDYRTIPPRELRRRVGMVMQVPYLFPGTVADNLLYAPRARGEELAAETVETLLAQVDLAGYGGRAVDTLSGGEAQRISLARTLANSPEILLLDEPTAALDEESKQEVEALILSIVRRQNLTCLFVTHDMAQVRRMVSHVMHMEKGRLVDFRPVQETRYASPVSV